MNLTRYTENKMQLYHCLLPLLAAIVALQSHPAQFAPNPPMVPDWSDVLSDEIIDYINQLNTTWKAGRNFDKNTPLHQINKLAGVRTVDGKKNLPIMVREIDSNQVIPDNFDARIQWPYCSTIGEIRDQGFCGSCWAFASVEVMSDRLCIASGGKVDVELSAQDLMTCCLNCTDNGTGCNGGYPNKAWDYYITDGIVSGGLYGTNKTCKPYQIPPSEHRGMQTCQSSKPSSCKKECEKGYSQTYNQDKHYGKTAYGLSLNVAQIQVEIMEHGPVTADLIVYSDLYHYKSGVYQHYSDNIRGLHSVKILGWGEDDYVPYWIVANSWNTNFGEKGFFKIVRGSNECLIEQNILAGLPKV